MKAELGIDGNCGFALLGKDLQSGEAEFVEIPTDTNAPICEVKRAACEKAFEQLKARLDRPFLGSYFGPSHPDYKESEDVSEKEKKGKKKKFICHGCFNPCILETIGFPETCCFGETGSRTMTASNNWEEFEEGEKK